MTSTSLCCFCSLTSNGQCACFYCHWARCILLLLYSVFYDNDVDIISAHSYHVQKLLLTFFCYQLLYGFTFFDNIINNLIANVDFRIDDAHTQSINFYMFLWQTNLAEFFDLHWSTWKCSVNADYCCRWRRQWHLRHFTYILFLFFPMWP